MIKVISYYRMCQQNIGKHYTVIIASYHHIRHLLLYITAEQLSSGLGKLNFYRVPEMVYITYNMGTWDLPDIYARALGPVALGLGHIYQANPSCPCYNYYCVYSYVYMQLCTYMAI